MLETERLVLRRPEESDFEAWAAFMADAEASRFVGGPQNRAVAWRGMAAIVGAWTLRGASFFSVLEKAGGGWVGRVGPWFPEGWPGREIAWGIAPAFQRRGYALEAAIATIDYAFETLGWDRVIHCIDPDNGPSIGLAERLGSRRERRDVELPPFETRVDVYGQSRAEWPANRAAIAGVRG